MSKLGSEKKKMATSREVYDRIVWDARLDRNAFAIGYQDRSSSSGIREKPLSEWETDGDIPWHRIRYMRCTETIVWDRDRHLDLFSTGQLPAAAWVTPKEEAHPATATSAFWARPVYRYDSQGWQPIAQQFESATTDALTIASFNVLCSLYETERIQQELRLRAIVEHLHNCNADIVALQEVTRSQLDALLAQDWVRGYFISESPEGSTLQPHGLLLLSRLPFALVEHRYSEHKRVLVGTWLLGGQPLRVAVVHLTSDRARNASEVRSRQLSVLLDYLKTQPGDCAIAGDFNIKGNEQQQQLTQSGLVDVWQVLHPFEEGCTFDPRRNPLAAMMSVSTEAARFDRILLRSQDGRWVPRSMELFACEPIPDTEETLYASDHFGVRAVLECSNQTPASLQTVRPVYQTAVVVIPPAEVWPAIQAIRRRHDRRIDRWMPHINLIYGFVPEEHFEEAAQAIARSLAAVKPFEVTLSGFFTFAHRSSRTAWLQPAAQPPEALHRLQAVLQQLFPQCDEQSTKSPAGFTPHLSVGQFESAEEAIAQLPSWHPTNFSVESVALISRRADEPFEVRYLVHLGQGNPKSNDLMQLVNRLEPELSQAQQAHRETVLAVVAQACAECLGSEPSLHLLGSARLGVESQQSDLDVLCLIPASMSGEAFLEGVRQRLSGLCDRSRTVKDAQVPVLRMQLEGVSLDLLYARSPFFADKVETPHTKSLLQRQHFDPISWKAFVGCLEADAIASIAGGRVPLECFRELLRAVRAWAKVRQIHGNAWGFLGSFSWALLAAWSCDRYPQDVADTRPEALLAHFFKALERHDWSRPVALTAAGSQYRVRVLRDWLPAVTSIEPCQNSARNVSRSTAQILRREFARGAELADRILACEIGWEALFESADLQAQSELFLVLTAAGKDSDALETCCGWLEGHAIALVIALEQQLDARVRPWPGIRKEENVRRVVLGLELLGDCDRASSEQIAKDFVLRFDAPDGITLESVLCDRHFS